MEADAAARSGFRDIKHAFPQVGLYHISRNKLEPCVVKPLFRDVFYLFNKRTAIFIHPRLSVVAYCAAFFTNGVDDDGECVAASTALNECDGDGLIKRGQ